MIHEDDGRTFGLDGKEVKGVNKFIRQKHHAKHHKKSHMREQSAIQTEGVDVADTFEYSLNPMERIFLKK